MRVADDPRPEGAPSGPAPARASDGLLHDLQDTVATVSAASSLLRASEAAAEHGLVLHALDAAARRLEHLTRALAVQNGRAPARPLGESVTLEAFVRDAEALARVRAQARGVSVGVTVDPRLDTRLSLDAVAVARIVDNLLSNAIDAASADPAPRSSHGGSHGGPDGGRGCGARVELTFTAAARGDGEPGDALVIEVADNGPGLGPDPERWFDAGESGHDSLDRGLGLWIARRSANGLGGQLSGETRSEGGARFRLMLPVDPPADLPSERPRALVLDTNPVSRELLRALLEDAGADVRTVSSTEGAVEAVARAAREGRPFRIAALDLHPSSDRARALDDAAERLREADGRLHVLAIAGSGIAASKAVASGAVAQVLAKPLAPQAIVRALDAWRTKAGPSTERP